ncbi:ABC transporter ATP-binding protein [Actinopolymorpha alba]|uniref:ABC transporter ATP-binding protein n=1 Tax=Actinopolymorpha alba TaxID=533267 RepID=UPI00036005FA|nr:ABC transporter ATP-binding protein [Actinopolymorpha alba]
MVATAVRVSPWQSLICLGESAGNVLQVLQPVFLTWIITGAISRDAVGVTVAAAAFVMSIAVERILLLVGAHARIGQLERVGYAFSTRIAEVRARIPTLDHLESPRYLDQLQTLRDQEGSLGVAFNTLLNVLADVTRVVAVLGLAASADWRLMLVAAAGVPSVLAVKWQVRWAAEAEKASAQPGRLSQHLLSLGFDATAGAELRVFGLSDEIRTRLRDAARGWRYPFVVQARRQAVLEIVNNAVFFGAAGSVLAWLTHDVISGTTSVGTLVLSLMLIGRLKAAAADFQESTRGVAGVIRTAGRFLWLLDYARKVQNEHAGRVPAPVHLSRGITLENLSFSYPNRERAAIDNISVHLRPGLVVAVVGENGAGKSTLAKLLTGLYRPTTGRILVDGIDLTDLVLASWRSRIAGAFQDYATLELTARETVGLGDVDRLYDDVRVHAAVETGAAEQVIQSLPQELATQLGATWPGGVGLSGGQWQRLALARGMMRHQPLLLILDEPTAALDATTEHALFERYAAAARANRRNGGITLLVTHRFSTVAAADLVVVLESGRITEQGTHAELLAANGHYAELYKLQARGYR